MLYRWRRIVSVILAVAAVIATSCVGRAQSDNQSIVYHGVTFPANFAGGTRISTRDFEPSHPGLGFSAGYSHRGVVSTLYIYDLKLTAIPDDLRAPLVVRQFEQAKGDIRQAQPAGATLNSKGQFMLADAGKRSRLLCEGFVLQKSSADAPVNTYVCLGVAKEKFFKVRTTLQSQSAESEMRRFIGAWVAEIWKP